MVEKIGKSEEGKKVKNEKKPIYTFQVPAGLEGDVDGLVKNGRYDNRSEAIRDLLRIGVEIVKKKRYVGVSA